jgi:hypothetical protein
VVSHGGHAWVAPAATQSYQLSAKVRNHSRILRTVTVQVDVDRCAILSTGLLPQYLVAFIEPRINADTSGIYLQYKRNLNAPPPPPVQVWISPGRLNVSLRLGKRVAWFPDPTIEISASFGLELVRETGYYAGGDPAAEARPLLTTRLQPTDEVISVDVNFPFYAWAVPGAVIGLTIAISGAEELARAKTSQMIAEIVKSLDTFFQAPPHTEKENAVFYVESSGDGIFEVTFCPPPKPAAVDLLLES